METAALAASVAGGPNRESRASTPKSGGAPARDHYERAAALSPRQGTPTAAISLPETEEAARNEGDLPSRAATTNLPPFSNLSEAKRTFQPFNLAMKSTCASRRRAQGSEAAGGAAVHRRLRLAAKD